MFLSGEKIIVKLKMSSQNGENATTRNLIGDYVGSKNPEEYVLISGHIDSWDVGKIFLALFIPSYTNQSLIFKGQGALDDGYGVILSVKAVEVLRALGLQPRRSIRTIIWSAEEVGKVPLGAEQYMKKHFEELKNNYSIFLEADSGIFDANGLIFNGTAEAGCIVAQVLKLLEPNVISKTKLFPHFPRLKTDIVPLMQATGVPGALIATNADKYFWFHHSNADTVTAIDTKDLDICFALYTSVAYVLADVGFMLPRVEI
jgi:carboxypeptidase Q